MRIEQLYYLVEVARHESFSIAAERLHISQPSISQAISNLEKEMGIKLFNRSRNGIHLTEGGEIFLQKSQEILKSIEELEMVARKEKVEYTGTLSIGAVPSICLGFLPKAMAEYKQRFPNVKLVIKEGGSLGILEEVEEGKLDLGFVAIPYPSLEDKGKLYFEALSKGELMACVGKNSSLSKKQSISPTEIVKEPLVLFNYRYTMNHVIKTLLQNYGELNILFESDNTESAKRVIAEGLAVGFYTDFSMKVDPYVKMGDIVPVPITENIVDITFGWIRSKNIHFSSAAREFIRIYKSQMRSSQPCL